MLFNRWISTKADQTKNKPILINHSVKKDLVNAQQRKPVKIDPLNDPLAPVVKKKEEVKRTEKKKTASKPIYEASNNSDALLF